MLVGLQGSGKTTMAAKLGSRLRSQGQRPLLVAADTYRPAAVTQLEVLGGQIDVPVHSEGIQPPPPDIVKRALRRAREEARTVVIIDTAGRLNIDEQMMDELVQIKALAQPEEVLLVVNSMTGQEAVPRRSGLPQPRGRQRAGVDQDRRRCSRRRCYFDPRGHGRAHQVPGHQ